MRVLVEQCNPVSALLEHPIGCGKPKDAASDDDDSFLLRCRGGHYEDTVDLVGNAGG